MKNLLLLVTLILPVNSFAVTFLPKGSSTTDDGYLFNIQEERQIRLINEENKYNIDLVKQLTNQNKILLDNTSIYEQRIANMKDSVETSAKTAIDAQNASLMRNMTYFGAGLLTALAAAYIASKAVR